MNKMNIVNAVLFQLTWLACVMGGAHQNLTWGFVGVGLMLLFSASQNTIRKDLPLVFSLAAFGWLLDSLWAVTGVLDYQSTYAPVWIVLLWIAVALTINHSMSWFKDHPLIGATLAACAAPMCYLGGERLGAVAVPNIYELIWVAAVWSLVFYILFKQNFNRYLRERISQIS